jgi:ATP-binding cassette subfamily B multidrug efflux pump
MKIAIDKYISKDNYKGLLDISIILVLLIFYRGIFTYVNTVYTQWIGQNAMKDIRMKVYEKTLSLDMAFFNKTPVGKLVTRMTNNVEDLNELLTSGIVALIGDAIRFVGIVIILYYLNPLLAYITYAAIPILAIITWIFSKYARKLYLNLKNKLTELNIFLQETLAGARVIQIFNREEKVKKDMKRYSQNYYIAAKKSIIVKRY